MSGYISTSIVKIFPYIVSLAFTLGIAIACGISAWYRLEIRRFTYVLMAELAWTAVFLLELCSPGVEAKLFWDAMHWSIMLFTDVCLVIFAYTYIDPSFKKPSPVIRAMLLTPVSLAVIAGLAAVLGFKAPLYAGRGYVTGLPFSELQYSLSPLAMAFIAYGYFLFAWTCSVLIRSIAKRGAARRAGVAIILCGVLLMFIGSTFGLFQIFPSSYRDSTPLWFSVGAVIMAYGLFSQRLFGSLSTARRAVMDALLDPVFVLGEGDSIVDCNAAAKTLLAASTPEPIGQSARILFADWPSSVNAALDFPEAETELDLPDRDGMPRRSYRITVASSAAKARSANWKLLVFNDITGQKRDARDLAATNEELEFWVRQRTTALRQEVAQRTNAEERLRDLNEEISKTQKEILWTLSEVVENRSRETAYHVVRVGEYAGILARAYGLPAEEADIVSTAAPMHDVGKIAIPDAILSKPGILTDEEREIMKRHTTVGKEILGSSARPLLRAAAVIAFEHHERWDGKGYPLGKSGSDISLSGRIVSLCDVFDALYTKRVYKDAWPLEKVLELFRKERGAAFDPNLVELLLDNIESILDVTRRYADEPEVLQAL